jgi:carboxypeptidase Q
MRAMSKPRLLISFALIAMLMGFTLASQQPGGSTSPVFSSSLLKDLAALRDAALASDYAYRQTAYLCNNIGPRLSGSPQAARAVEYVAAEMRKLGLEVQLENIMVPHWVRGVETGELTQFPGMAAGTTQKIVLTALGGSVATPAEGLVAPVIVVNNFEELNALGRARVAGRIVLFNARFNQQMADQGEALDAYREAVAYRGVGASAAARLGAVAALNRSAGGANYRLPHTGGLRYTEDAPRIPAAGVTAEDAELIAHLAAQGEVKMKLTLTPQTLPDVASHNVIADIKGSEFPDQVVIVSGHLDSWDLGTGALDDAVGVTASMQAANLIKQLKLKPKRTIRIIAWMNEENGLRGGTAYAQNRAGQMTNQVAAIELDLGAGHPIGIYANATPAAAAMLQPLAEILRPIGAGIIRQVTHSVGADISPLEAAGVPGFAPITDARHYFDYHHTPADTLDKVLPRELAENAAVMATLAYTLANLPQPLPRISTIGGN